MIENLILGIFCFFTITLIAIFVVVSLIKRFSKDYCEGMGDIYKRNLLDNYYHISYYNPNQNKVNKPSKYKRFKKQRAKRNR